MYKIDSSQKCFSQNGQDLSYVYFVCALNYFNKEMNNEQSNQLS